jgi:hypothetical protein
MEVERRGRGEGGTVVDPEEMERRGQRGPAHRLKQVPPTGPAHLNKTAEGNITC